MMDNKKGMCGDCSDGGHGSDNNCGRCDHCLAGKHHGLARMLLCLSILFFVFWIGLAMGEFKAYIRQAWNDGGYGAQPMMWQINSRGYKMMDPTTGYNAAAPSATPTPKK